MESYELALRRLLNLLPKRSHRFLRRLWYAPVDAVERLLGRRKKHFPPRGRMFDGADAFAAVGEDYLRHLRELCHLRPTDRVLDFGCGIGRIALPLLHYLDAGGEYHGIDATRSDVRWCRRALGRKFPNFHFHFADVRNGEYNPGGRIEPTDYRFPFADRSFDVVFAVSVFTHLLAPEASHYLAEMARVLKPGGWFLITLFVLNEATRSRPVELTFRHPVGPALVEDPENPEAAVAYEEAFIRAACKRSGLRDEVRILPGSWSDPPQPVSYQEILVARK